MECLVCYSLWETDKDGNPCRTDSQFLTSETSTYLVKLLGLTRPSAKEDLIKCDFCHMCADKLGEVRVLMKQLESLEKQISSFREEFKSEMVKSYLEQEPGKEVIDTATKFTRRCRSEILSELQLVETEPSPKKGGHTIEKGADEVGEGEGCRLDDEDTNNIEGSELVAPDDSSLSLAPEGSDDAIQTLGPVIDTATSHRVEIGVNLAPLRTNKELVIRVERLSPSFIESMTMRRSGTKQQGTQSLKADSYNCSRCEKVFSTKRKLTIHHRISHRGELTHICSTCSKGFKRKQELFAHEFLHIPEEAVKCEKCNVTVRHTHSEMNHQTVAFVARDAGISEELKKQKRSTRTTDESPVFYPCPHCDSKFPTRYLLIVHRGSAHDEKNFSCSTCGMRFLFRTALRNHKIVHTDLRPYKCERCPRTYRHPTDYYQHRKVCAGEMSSAEGAFPCSSCWKSFPSLAKLRNHGLVHTDVKPHQCDKCFRRFRNRSSCYNHKKFCTGNEDNSDKEGATIEEKSVTVSSEDPVEAATLCPHCAKVFPSYSKLTQHIRCHRQLPRKFVCKYCSKAFPQPGVLKRHEAIHFPDRPYVCEFCGKGYKDRGTLRIHKLKGCSKNVRIRIKCEVCGKAFKYQESREKHMRTHEGDPKSDEDYPVPCDSCDRWFRSQEVMAAHRAAVHLETHSCTICDQTFDSELALRDHRSTEHFSVFTKNKAGEWGCPDCDFVASSKKHLNIHYVSHTEGLPYSCIKCDKRYKRKTALRRHQKAVHGIRAYAPGECLRERQSIICIKKCSDLTKN